MDHPKPPDDLELKNIIDKLANFVARNGPEFEEMTKNKQKDNLKFSFLFGGEHFNYYQHRVTTEQVVSNAQKAKMVAQQITQQALQQQQQQQQQQQPAWQPPQGALDKIQQLQQQIQQQQETVAAQIKTSENNLAAQYQSLIQQQQIQIEDVILKVKNDHVLSLCQECDIPIGQLDDVCQPIVSSCTKDAISYGKNWIFNHCISAKHCELIAQYLCKRITNKEASFELRLHLIYLINDVLHHCQRKSIGDLKDAIESVVIPVFCSAHIGVDEDKQQKLVKLLGLWTKNEYFQKYVLDQLKDPASAMATYQANLITENANVVTQISTSIQDQYSKLQQQHSEYANHLTSSLQQQTQQLRQQVAAAQALLAPPPVGQMPPVQQTGGLPPPVNTALPPPGFDPSLPPPGFPPPPSTTVVPQQFDYAHGQSAPVVRLPDFSKPPPGFGLPPADLDLMPTVPYYELPAGLMAPLVKLEDCDYKPLDPMDIRLPPPMPPTERLLLAVEAFYSPPTHERPRDSEGWEKLGLFEFFKAKEKAKKMAGTNRRRSRSRSRSPVRPKRRYASRSRSRSRSRSASRSRSRSHSPRQRRSRSLSRSRSRSTSPANRRRRSLSRSPTPPSFSEPFYAANVNTRLSQDNKGHMLMKKMGWGGAGLGANEQGREDPINAHGEVRENMDKYKGIGLNMQDPFEQFRKHRSQGFIARMKSRDEMRKEARRAKEARNDDD